MKTVKTLGLIEMLIDMNKNTCKIHPKKKDLWIFGERPVSEYGCLTGDPDGLNNKLAHHGLSLCMSGDLCLVPVLV
ncbi:hypothetical protein ACJX0J_006866, partial [Zea mays]